MSIISPKTLSSNRSKLVIIERQGAPPNVYHFPKIIVPKSFPKNQLVIFPYVRELALY